MMRNVLRVCLVVLAVFPFVYGSGFVWAKDLRVGVEGAYPPFSFKDTDGEIKGFDIEIASALCEEMAVKCTMVEQDWDGMIPALISRRFDMIVASMSVTEERKRRVDFTDKYYNTPTKLVGRKGSGIKGTISGLSGKKVGVQRGSTHQCYVEKFFTDSAVKLYATQEDVFLDLVAGRIDVQLSDSVQAEEGFLNTPEGSKFGFVGGNQYDLACYGVGAGVAVRKGEDGLRKSLNKAIKAIRASGEYKRINDKYFSFDVYGE